jgi:hypothetical protein
MTVQGCVVIVVVVVVVVASNGNGFQPSGNVALKKFSICNITEQTLASLPYLFICFV